MSLGAVIRRVLLSSLVWRLVFVRILLVVLVVVVLGCGVFVGGAWGGVVGWKTHLAGEPSSFAVGDEAACDSEGKCDRYQVLVQNVGSSASAGVVTVTFTAPPGITISEVTTGLFSRFTLAAWQCESVAPGATKVSCVSPEGESVAPGHYLPYIMVVVSAPLPGVSGVLSGDVKVEGGGAGEAGEDTLVTPVGRPLAFEVNEDAFEPELPTGALAVAAGGHPWVLTTDTGVPAGQNPAHRQPEPAAGLFSPAHNIHSISIELPAGFVGDPLATPRCTEAALRSKACPHETRVGVFGLLNGKSSHGEWAYSEDESAPGFLSSVFNVVPEAGYPAELGLSLANENVPVLVYANVVHTASGYRVRVTVPGAPAVDESFANTVSIFGDPGQVNGTGGEAAFLTSPSDCEAETEGVSNGVAGTAKDFNTRVELTPWNEPDHVFSQEAGVFPALAGCSALSFDPSLAFGPSPEGTATETQQGSSTADEPSAYTVGLSLPQTTGYREAATPDLRDAAVTLPAGVSADPSSATGLVGCKETGPEGINVGSNNIGPGGEDLGDPEATELGEGHAGPGGNNSPYDDGFWHTERGHCPAASELGTIEVTTPLLEQPLHGRIYLAEPKCGGDGQKPCEESSNPAKDSAENGELFGGYLEIEGAGVIIKLAGKIAANPATGQLTGEFDESPQFPFNDLKLHFKGGARAPVANPQTCGAFSAASTMTSWAGQSISGATPAFDITGCGASMPFSPSLSAGLSNTTAGAVGSSFVLRFSRQDREQDFSGVSETMPPGLVGAIADTTLCGEEQANAGTCGPESRIGNVTALAGPGPEPFRVEGGAVYLTGPYAGAPFGLSIVVPTKAGPFNLGNEIIRAAVHINPSTSQVTVVTNRLPQSKFGVPFRVREVITEINRPGFLHNPTSCGAQSLTATLSAAQGATANVSAPLQATGCPGLPFYPGYTETTQGNTSKANGASLTVGVSQNPGESNIAKVEVQLPINLPSRLTTLQKACTESQFAANPAGCPEASDIGTAEAVTPLLKNALKGPAYIVSHGNAAFPDVEFVLQGEGITIVLDGKTDIKHGVTYSKFETVPDAPVKSFTSHFPEGPHSVLAAYGNLCHPTETITTTKHTTKRVHGHVKHITTKVKKTVAKKLISPVTITGQNGTVVHDNVNVGVINCPKTKPATKPTTKKKTNKKKAKKKKKG